MKATLCTTAVVVLVLGALTDSTVYGQDREKEPVIGEVRLRVMAPITFAYVPAETTFDRLGETIGEAMPLIEKAATEGKVRVTSPFVLSYPEGSAHLMHNKQFKVQIGLKVEEGSTPQLEGGDVKVRTTEPFKCATIMYMGPIARIGDSYQKLFPAIEKMGLAPTGEEREFTLYFESLESGNNVILIQVGVKDKDKPPGENAVRPGQARAAAVGAPAVPAGGAIPAKLKLLDPLNKKPGRGRLFQRQPNSPAPSSVRRRG